MRRRAGGNRSPSAPPSRGRAQAPADRRHAPILELQRAAGNAAVTGLVTGQLVLQRHKGIDPAVSAAHVLTAAEEKELPAVADAPGLAKEQAELRAERAELNKKIKEAGATPDPADTERVKVINTRLSELYKKLQLRVKGDEAETLARNTIKGGTKAWFADIQTITFLGRPATVHKLLAERLAKAEAALKGVPPPTNGWVQEGHSTLRPPGESLHSFGLAIDLNPSTNPFLVEPTGQAVYEPPAWSRSIKDVIDNAVLLVLARNPADDPFFARPKEADKDKRVEASYDKMAAASQALVRYLTLADPAKHGELQGLVDALGAKDPKKRTAAQWVKTIKADRSTIKTRGGQKSWSKPEKGFLDLDKRLVKAMTDSTGAGLTWLGDDTIAGRDVMHFDMRGVGPITAIWKSVEGRAIGLGGG